MRREIPCINHGLGKGCWLSLAAGGTYYEYRENVIHVVEKDRQTDRG